MTGRPEGAAAAEEDECARNAQGEIERVGIHTPAKAAAELLTKDRRDKFILVASPIPNFHTDKLQH